MLDLLIHYQIVTNGPPVFERPRPFIAARQEFDLLLVRDVSVGQPSTHGAQGWRKVTRYG